MSKETIKMNAIRINRIGIKEVLWISEQMAYHYRKTISENWDKEDNAESRKTLYNAHRNLAKTRKVIRECQRQLKATKLEIRKLNRQHDIHMVAIAESKKN